jgi:multiple sugar transport system permease protein
MISVYLLIDIPFVTWLLRGFFKEIPKEIEEAALLDGSSEWNTLTRIVIPLAKGGIVVTFVFAFVNVWNEFLLALILTGAHTETVPIFISSLETVLGIQWGPLTAATVVLSLPMILLAIYLRREIATGLTLGAVRG